MIRFLLLMLRSKDKPQFAIDTLTIVLLTDIVVQQLLLFSRKRATIQKIGSAFPGTPQGLLQTPAPDVFVVAAEQHRQNTSTLVHLGSGVVRAVEQAVGKRVLLGGIGVSQSSAKQPRDRIDQHHGRQLTAGQDVI